jgi:hypothetical protein
MSEAHARDWQGGAFWRTDRGRLLLVLAIVAVLSSAGAAFAVLSEAQRTAPRYSPQATFPDLANKLEQAALISMTSPEGSIEIRRTESGQWVVPSASNYPAHLESVRKMLFGLASLKAVEARTARRDWLATLDLIAPNEGGRATEIRVSDTKGSLIAGLYVGKLRLSGVPAGADAFYVRRVDQDQSFLAEGELPLDVGRGSWLDPTIVDLPRERVYRVTITPQEGAAFSVSRSRPETQDFVLDSIPKGRSMVSETAANPIGAALSDFTLEDVRPRAEVDFAKPVRAAFETFDGLTVTVEAIQTNGEHWVRVSASTEAPVVPHTGTAALDVAEEASAIDTRTGAWAYKIPDWKAELFSRSVESLLAEPNKEAAKPGEPQ